MSFKFTRLHAAVVVILAVVLVGGYALLSNASPQVVANGDVVWVNYTGMFTNGTVFDASYLHPGGKPLNFTVGSGQVIQGFDQAVIGMSVGETKNVTIPPDMAYGPINPNAIIEVPANVFGNQTVEAGMTVTSTEGQEGVITAANKTVVTVDFNSPLAGKTLIFKITVVKIQAGSSS